MLDAFYVLSLSPGDNVYLAFFSRNVTDLCKVDVTLG